MADRRSHQEQAPPLLLRASSAKQHLRRWMDGWVSGAGGVGLSVKRRGPGAGRRATAQSRAGWGWLNAKPRHEKNHGRRKALQHKAHLFLHPTCHAPSYRQCADNPDSIQPIGVNKLTSSKLPA